MPLLGWNSAAVESGCSEGIVISAGIVLGLEHGWAAGNLPA